MSIKKRVVKDNMVQSLYESSNILASTYDGKDLTVIFKGGASYTYQGVSNTDFARFETTDSQGKFLNTKIKPTYSFEKNEAVNEESYIREIEEIKVSELETFEKGVIGAMDNVLNEYTNTKHLNVEKLSLLINVVNQYKVMVGTEAQPV